MKNIVRIASALALVVLAASCSKMAPSKSEVEAGFSGKYTGKLPEVAIVGTPECDAINGAVTVKVSVTGITAELGKVVLGVLSSNKESFDDPKSGELEVSSDGTYEITGSVSANSTWYLKATASTDYGCAYSDALRVAVPDIPFFYKISGSWSGTVTSLAYGDQYTSVLEIILDDEDPENTCYVGNLEPYYASKGYVIGEEFNYIVGTIDNENSQIILETGNSLHLGGRYYFATDAEGGVIDGDVLKLSADGGSLVRSNGFYTVTSEGEAEDWYSGAVYKKK